MIRLLNENEGAEALDRQTRVLLGDFRRLEGVTASIQQGPTPSGSRGDPVTVGTILLAAVSGGSINAIFQALGDWVKRGENRTVTLKVSVDGNTFEAEFPSKGMTQNDLLELTEKVKQLLAGSKKRKG
jgi:hypothetical protein